MNGASMDPAFQERWHLAYDAAPELFEAFCLAEDPEDRIAQRLLELLDPRGRTVLELGCGTGRLGEALASQAGRYVGLDVSWPMLARARARESRRAALIQARGEALPLRDGSIDAIVAAWVLVNLPPHRSERILNETQRVLRPSGGGLWLVESLGGTEFQNLRAERAEVEETRTRRLVEAEGFREMARMRTHLQFTSEAEAEEVLGHLCGDAVRQRLRKSPRRRIEHGAVILHRPS